MLASAYRFRRIIRRSTPPIVGVVSVIGGFTALQMGLAPKAYTAAVVEPKVRSSELAATRGGARSLDEPLVVPAPLGAAFASPPTTAAEPATTVPPPSVAPSTVVPATVVPESAAPATTLPPVVEVAAPATSIAPAATSGRVQSGVASYYDHKPGGCAHKTLPKGTVVTVTNLSNNKSATCTVNDRGPFVAGRIIDLETRTFKQVSSTSAGVFNARISW